MLNLSFIIDLINFNDRLFTQRSNKTSKSLFNRINFDLFNFNRTLTTITYTCIIVNWWQNWAITKLAMSIKKVIIKSHKSIIIVIKQRSRRTNLSKKCRSHLCLRLRFSFFNLFLLNNLRPCFIEIQIGDCTFR